MHQATIRNGRTLSNARRLVHRHFCQIAANPQDPRLADYVAITFLPGDRTNTFNGQLLRRIGTSLRVVMSYGQPHPDRPKRLTMPIRGYRAKPNPDGSVEYGGQNGFSFLYDAALPPRPTARGQAICALRNSDLAQLVLMLDQVCKRRLTHGPQRSPIPRLPKIWLAFAPNEAPTFEDSPGLRRLAARELGVPVERLGSNGTVLLDRLLRDLWESQLIPPGAPGNPTDKLLVDAELCTQARRSLEIYEDFSGLLGAHFWNPARSIEFLKVENPARDVLRRFHVDTSQDFNQPFSDDLIEQLELAMRESIGPLHRRFTCDEILDGLTSPAKPLVAYEASLMRLRSRLPPGISERVSDDDLLRAARRPTEPLVARNACCFQVLKVRPGREGAHFSSETLNRRIDVDLNVPDFESYSPKWPGPPTREEQIPALAVIYAFP